MLQKVCLKITTKSECLAYSKWRYTHTRTWNPLKAALKGTEMTCFSSSVFPTALAICLKNNFPDFYFPEENYIEKLSAKCFFLTYTSALTLAVNPPEREGPRFPCCTEHCLQFSEPFLHLVLCCFAALKVLQQVGDVHNGPFVVYDIGVGVVG